MHHAARKPRTGKLPLLQLFRKRHAHQHQVPQRPQALHDGEGRRADPLQHRRHTGHAGMHHHRGRIRRRRLHERRTKGCDLRARRRAEQPHLDGPFCGYTLRAEATHLHRHRRGQLRPAAATGTRTAPRSRTLPLGTFRAGMQGCQRASDKVWRGKSAHYAGTG